MLDGVTSLDGRVAVWVATHRVAAINDVFVWLGWIDRLGAVWVVIALLVSTASWHRFSPVVGVTALTAAATLTADGAAMGIKELVHRTRPFVAHPQIHPLYVVHSSSFPSGHAATAFAGAVVASYLLPRATPLFVAFACAIAFSRIYVGGQSPGDVGGGAPAGRAAPEPPARRGAAWLSTARAS
jgi:undecaprenyl-diphosphatase